ncbi:MAG: 30S ribosomal protein S7 [Candidatus Woykebacteria bacterium RBG_13_40_7b]|uniref:Small ribosomal subunit protein uS7 n=1 Tax=Candidatus Woykebacteria bacterium RBG_13_40_7b TaxID=1802594 RepID=A0A1G1W801_9BACT|nr:MAG: 30S ribosomal protein S7 [Candidatus Woykebacteria bacterium RBG_13_40_7b]
MRGKKAKKRKIEPDVIYNNRGVTRLINKIMRGGKKSVAQAIVYNAFEKIGKEASKEPVEVFEAALRNVQPQLEVRPRRVGGASYQVPLEVKGERKISLALHWIIQTARKKSSSEYKTMAAKLAAELTEASQGTGGAVKKKQDIQKMAEANRAFAHFRW